MVRCYIIWIDRYLNGEYIPSEQELRGMKLFMTGPSPQDNIRGANCGHCHGTPKMFKELFHNNGLDTLARDVGRMGFTGQEIDRGRFRVPTLRNIELTSPYMHDGRFGTLQEVLDRSFIGMLTIICLPGGCDASG